MMKINWKVRLKHKQFWIALFSVSVLLLNQIASIFDMDVTIISSKIQQSFDTVLIILAMLGVVIDPTTTGIKDSAQALTYTEPRKDVNEKQE